MVRGAGSLPPMSEAWIEFLVFAFGCLSSGCCEHVGNELVDGSALSASQVNRIGTSVAVQQVKLPFSHQNGTS